MCHCCKLQCLDFAVSQQYSTGYFSICEPLKKQIPFINRQPSPQLETIKSSKLPRYCCFATEFLSTHTLPSDINKFPFNTMLLFSLSSKEVRHCKGASKRNLEPWGRVMYWDQCRSEGASPPSSNTILPVHLAPKKRPSCMPCRLGRFVGWSWRGGCFALWNSLAGDSPSTPSLLAFR